MSYLPTPSMPLFEQYRMPSMLDPLPRVPTPPPQPMPVADVQPKQVGKNPYAFADDTSGPLQEITDAAAAQTKPKKADDILARVREILKSMPGAPDYAAGYAPGDYTARYTAPQARAMTPLEGPDTGAPNPNVGTPVGGGYFSHLRAFEDPGGDPARRNPTSGATGLYQFMPGTWADIVKNAPWLHLTTEGITDPDQQERAIHYYTDKSRGLISSYLNRAPTPGELYALHLFGQSGGMQVVRNPNAMLKDILPPDFISANAGVVNPYMTGQEALAKFNTLMGG